MGSNMTEQQSAHSTEYRDEYTNLAQGLARLGLSEEGIAQFFKVPVYTLYEWMETKPEFAAAIERGWDQRAMQPPRPPSRYKYPAYTYALQLAARIKDTELAGALRAKMAEMKAIGPHAMAAFNDALWEDAMAIQPGRRIPKRVGA